jgi:BON domain-containing protein
MADPDDDAPGRPGSVHGPPTDGEPGDDWGDVQIGRWQSGPPPRAATDRPGGGERPSGGGGVGPDERRPDARIEDALRDALAADAGIDPGDVTIGVREGAVTMEGVVADDDARTRVAERAWEVAGVREVHNRLRVAGAAPAESTGEDHR